MGATWGRHTVLAGAIAAAAGAFAQEPQPPTGKFRSGTTETFANPFLAGAGLYLDLDVASNGTFTGTWGQYFCTGHPGAYGIAIQSCTMYGATKPVSGRFTPGRQGVINLEQLGLSTFTWTAPSADELAIDLPKYWRGEEEDILWRARMTRDGKPKPAAASAPADSGPLLSAVVLYREFWNNENAALARYRGKTLVLEGRRGTLIALSNGGAAVHIPDGFQPRALVLEFPVLSEVSGIAEGTRFSFRCTVKDFEYQYVQMDGCSVVR